LCPEGARESQFTAVFLRPFRAQSDIFSTDPGLTPRATFLCRFAA